MGPRFSLYFPFLIAVLMPPAGLILGLIGLQEEDREKGFRLLVVSAMAVVVWALILLS